MTSDGFDLPTVLAHEMEHLLGYEHDDGEHGVTAPVLAVLARPAADVGRLAREDAWGLGSLASAARDAGVPSADSVFRELGRADSGAGEESAGEARRLELSSDARRTAAAVALGEEAG